MIGLLLSPKKAYACRAHVRKSSTNLSEEQTISFKKAIDAQGSSLAENLSAQLMPTLAKISSKNIAVCVQPSLVYITNFTLTEFKKSSLHKDILHACSKEFPDPIDTLSIRYKIIDSNKEGMHIAAVAVSSSLQDALIKSMAATGKTLHALYSPALLSLPTKGGLVFRVYQLADCEPSIALYKDGIPIDEALLKNDTPAAVVKELLLLKEEYTPEEPVHVELCTTAEDAKKIEATWNKEEEKMAKEKKTLGTLVRHTLATQKTFSGTKLAYLLAAWSADAEGNSWNILQPSSGKKKWMLLALVIVIILAGIWGWYLYAQ